MSPHRRSVPLVELWRGDLLESEHSGHAVVCRDDGEILRAWGDADAVIYPRSSAKMIQALPLVTSGAAAKHHLTSEQLALACASHNGADIHTSRVQNWLDTLGLNEASLLCGVQPTRDRELRDNMIRAGQSACQFHNNCSGKHAGFLTLTQHLQASSDYVDISHPVQKACRTAFEEVTDATSPGYGIDGCSAPNFATTVHGLARAMAWFASASARNDISARSATQLVEAMIAHPELVAGRGRACTRLMRATQGRAAIKTGAEGVFVAIIPEKKIGIALKISDGATRAAETVIAALLVRYGVLDADHPEAQAYTQAPITNWAGTHCGEMRPVSGLVG